MLRFINTSFLHKKLFHLKSYLSEWKNDIIKSEIKNITQWIIKCLIILSAFKKILIEFYIQYKYYITISQILL